MTIEEMLLKVLHSEDGLDDYIPIHELIHNDLALKSAIHGAAGYLMSNGYPMESGIEVGISIVLDAIRAYGTPENIGTARKAVPESGEPGMFGEVGPLIIEDDGLPESLLDGIDLELGEN